jgi:hypothetical protein
MLWLPLANCLKRIFTASFAFMGCFFRAILFLFLSFVDANIVNFVPRCKFGGQIGDKKGTKKSKNCKLATPAYHLIN